MNSTKNIDFICVEDEFENSIINAKKIYLEGGVFVYPTDTIYGLGANPFNEEALEKVNEIKGRHEGKNYILLIDSIDTLSKYVELNSEKHLDFLVSIWPNPVSVVLNLNKKTSSILQIDTAAVSGIFYSNKKYFDKVSTLIDLTGNDLVLLREGRVKFDELVKKYK